MWTSGVLSKSMLSASKSLRPLVTIRSISHKQKLYGNEEGHDKKNEVRKEDWINKHKRRRTLGGSYREDVMKKTRNLHSAGNAIVDLPDWSYPDGSVGILTMGQQRRIEEKKELIADILEAYNIVQEASKLPKEN